MLTHVVSHKQLPCQAGLMDTWDATKALLLFSESFHQLYYGPLKDNRQVDAASGAHPCRRVDALAWSTAELAYGKRIKSQDFPPGEECLNNGEIVLTY
jgi:hypothetical protein